MKIEIRAAVLADVDRIALIEAKADRNKFYGGCADITKAEKFRTDSFTCLINGGENVFVLLADGVINAVCAFVRCKGSELSEYAEIAALCVIPEMQRKGYARRLLSHCLDIASEMGFKGAYVRCLECTDDPREQGTFRFFESFGFERRDSKPDRDNIFEIIFTKGFKS